MWLGCVEVDVVCLCGCKCLQACTTTLNQFSVMRGEVRVAGRADNGWEGVHNTRPTRQPNIRLATVFT